MKISEVVTKDEYDFLKANKYLGGNLMFLCLGGSHAYGTNNEKSDIDVRGCALSTKRNILIGHDFEQIIDSSTDTTIYSFTKLVQLLTNCNPNVIELLGTKPEHTEVRSVFGKVLLENKKLFLSQRAISSFSGYASQQLRRLQNAVARDSMSDEQKEQHILMSLNSMMSKFNYKYNKGKYFEFTNGDIRLFIDSYEQSEFGEEILMDIDLKGYPLRDYVGIWSEMKEIVRIYGKLNHRNNKKSDAGLNKHAMHLIRLYLMVLDILEKQEINTYRENDIDMLMSIRAGKYMNEDGTYHSDFFELVSEFEKRVEYARENTSLPEQPDTNKINDLVEYIHGHRMKAGF